MQVGELSPGVDARGWDLGHVVCGGVLLGGWGLLLLLLFLANGDLGLAVGLGAGLRVCDVGGVRVGGDDKLEDFERVWVLG